MSAAFTALSAELLANGCAVRFRAEGGSMHPTIRSGELIIVEPVDPVSIRRGDILLAKSHGRIVAHRVTAIEAGEVGLPRFTLRGDAIATPDAPVGAAGVLGLVRTVERGGRQVRLPRWRPSAVRLVERFSLRVQALLRTAPQAR